MQGMREGRGKWVDSNGTIYEGKYFSNLVQAFSNKILNMGLEKSGTVQERDTRDSLLKEAGRKGLCMRKMGILSKWGDDLYCRGLDMIFYFYFHS